MELLPAAFVFSLLKQHSAGHLTGRKWQFTLVHRSGNAFSCLVHYPKSKVFSLHLFEGLTDVEPKDFKSCNVKTFNILLIDI